MVLMPNHYNQTVELTTLFCLHKAVLQYVLYEISTCVATWLDRSLDFLPKAQARLSAHREAQQITSSSWRNLTGKKGQVLLFDEPCDFRTWWKASQSSESGVQVNPFRWQRYSVYMIQAKGKQQILTCKMLETENAFSRLSEALTN